MSDPLCTTSQQSCLDTRNFGSIKDDDDEFRFKDMSTHEGHLLQDGILTWFCSEMAIMIAV